MKIKIHRFFYKQDSFLHTEYDSNGAHDFIEYSRYAKNPTVKVSTNFSQQINCEKQNKKTLLETKPIYT